MFSATQQDGVDRTWTSIRDLVATLEFTASEALEPLVQATSNVVEAFGTMGYYDKARAAHPIETAISDMEELCRAVNHDVVVDEAFLATLKLYSENVQALANRLQARQSECLLQRLLYRLEMDDVLHAVQDTYDSCMAAITMHHIRRKDRKDDEAASPVYKAEDDDRNVDEFELLASEVEVADVIVFQTDVSVFWQNTFRARLNYTNVEEDRNAPPDPDRRKKCIVREFQTDREKESFRAVVDFLLSARHPNLPQMHGFYHDDSASFLVLKIAAVRPFKCYLEQYCQDHSAKEAILCFLIVLTDLRQLLEFLEDHDILKDRKAISSMLKAENLMFDHLERVIAGPVYASNPVAGKKAYRPKQQSKPWELIVEAARSYRPPPPPPGVNDADYWGSPLIQVIDSLRHNAHNLLFTDWHLAGGGYDWREEYLEQFDPPDPYEAEEFANVVDVEDISIGSVSAVAPESRISALEEDSDTEYTSSGGSGGSATSGSKGTRKRPKRIPPILRSSRRKRQELPGTLIPGDVKGRGGYADVRIGEWFPPGATKPMVVAIKYPRPVGLNDLDEQEKLQVLLKRLYQEVITWQYIRHRYVLPILGFITVPNPCIVAPWCRFGNILNYLSVKKRVNRLYLSAQIAEGLAYLHSRSPPFIHGDLKPDNILVNDDEDPVLADFGLAQITRDVLEPNETGSATGTPIWMAPELYDEDAKISAASDIYAFAFIVIQLYSEKLPFFDILPKGVVQLMMAIMTGVRPKIEDYPLPPYLEDKTTEYEGLWPLLAQWWDQDPGQRPTAEEVHRQLRARLNRIDP